MRKSSSDRGAGIPSQRQLRVAEAVRHAIADILSRGTSHDPALDGMMLTIPEVRMSPDLKNATVLVMPLGGRDVEKTLAALDAARGRLKGMVGRQAGLRFVPELRFRLDTRYDDDNRIDGLLRDPTVRRDVDAAPADGDDDER
jgi:ribosome-binding factor A